MEPSKPKTDASTAISSTRGQPTLAPQIPDHELLRRIGGGSYGEVWLARNVMGTYRAVKIVCRDRFDHERPYEREFQGIQRFEPISRTHESQVDILHVGRNDPAGYFYYVMELADDASQSEAGGRRAETEQILPPVSRLSSPIFNPDTYLAKTLRSELFSRGRLPLEECLQIGLSLTSALAHLHQHGLVHRDIKPSNIIFVNGIPKLADLGLVADVGRTMSFVGTEGYLPPEGPGNPQADIYSLGKVLYEICTGKDRQEFPELPTNLEVVRQREELLEFNEVLVKACDADAHRRYQTAQEMHADLVLLQSGKSVVRLRTLERRLAAMTKIGIAAVVVALLTAGGLYLARREAEASRREAKITQQHLVKLSTANGVRLMEERDLFPSLVWFTEALRLDQGNRDREYVHRLRIGSILQQGPKLVGLSFHHGFFNHLEFSPDGRRLVTANADRTARGWDARNGEPVTPSLRHAAAVEYASFSPDGSQVVTGGRDSTAQIWNAVTGEPIGPPLKHKHRSVWYAAFSPDGQRVLTVCSFYFLAPAAALRAPVDGTAEAVAWDAATGERMFALTNGAAFSPDGQRIVTVNPDPEDSNFELAQVWDVATGKSISPPMKQQSYNSASFSPDGRAVALTSGVAGTRIWNALTGEPITPVLKASFRVLFSPDSRWIVSVGVGPAARVWDASTGEPVTPPLQQPNQLVHAQFSPDNRYLLTSGSDGSVRLWEISTGRSVGVPLTHGHRIWRAAFSPDGRQIAAGGDDGTMRIWNLAAVHGSALELTEAPESLLYPRWQHKAALSPDGRRAATISDDAAVRVRDVQTGKMLFPPIWHSVLPSDSDEWVSSVVFSRDGSRVGSQTYYNYTLGGQERPYLFEARVWDAATGKQLTPTLQIEGAKSTGVTEAYFDPDCRRLVVLRRTNQVELWDMATARLVNPPLKHGGRVGSENGGRGADFSPDGSLIVTTDREKTEGARSGHVYVWRVDTGEKVAAPLKFTEETTEKRSGKPQDRVWLNYVGFSPDGKRVVAATMDNSVHMLDAQTSRLVVSFPTQTQAGSLGRVVFSPDSRRLLTEAAERTRIWDAATGKPLTPILRNVGIEWFNSFSRDGRLVLTAGAGRIVARDENGWPRVWDAQKGEPITPRPPPRYSVGCAELSSDARRVLMACYDGHARVWELNEERRPAEDLVLLARVLSGQEIDANGSLSPLEPAALSNAWQRLRLKYPAAFTTTTDDLVRWNWDESEAAAKAKQWSGALFHLDHLINAQPTNKLYWSRRGYAHAALSNWNAAAADFSQAVKLGVGDRRVLKSWAITQLAAADLEAYRKTCAALLKTLESPDGLRAGPEVALVCLLA
ncbi:MAG: protein kinase, partial [Verrucomicrobia bacterium]|nr:protein kinase [Verrucomicrobiota bacterium]